jgi:peptide/nickel transport system ATP-binding protein
MVPAAMTDERDHGENGEDVTTPLLEIRGLSVSYRTRGGTVEAVRGVDLDVWPGQVTAVVGESGSGKSTTAHAITRLLPGNGGIDAGTVHFGRHDLATLSEAELRTVRGARIGLVPQDPTVSLNPVKRIGDQVTEVLRIHGLATRRSAPAEAVAVLDRAGLPDAAVRARQYPHELSGGMRQRALIAIAIAARPELITADEPTSALDVTVQRVILDHLQRLTEESGTAVLLVTHDLGVAADRAQRLVVMSQGSVVEAGPTRDILANRQHEYTRHLLAGAPSLTTAPPRTPVSIPEAQTAPLVEVRNLAKEFRLPRTGDRPRTLRAVDDVSLTLHRGQTLALVGESGSGKSTTARLVLRLTDATAGQILFDGIDVTTAKGAQARQLRRRAQLVYQNPYASLDHSRSATAPPASPGPANSSTGWRFPAPHWSAGRRSCPADSDSAWRSPARSPSPPTWWCVTSRSPPSTCPCRPRSWTCSPSCMPTRAWPTSSSRTTWPSYGRSRTRSPSCGPAASSRQARRRNCSPALATSTPANCSRRSPAAVSPPPPPRPPRAEDQRHEHSHHHLVGLSHPG